MKNKLSILTVVLFLMTTPAFAEVYQLITIETSLPTIADWVGENPVGDHGDVISQYGEDQAWFCFDLTEIPDSERIIAASFMVRMRDFADDHATERTLWYDPDDSWWDSWPHDPDLDEVKIVDELIGVISFEADGWTWATFEIDITQHDWSDDLIDNYVSLMLTGPLSGSYSAGEVDFREACLELVTASGSGDNDGDDDDGDDDGDNDEDDDDIQVNTVLNLGPVEFVQADGNDIEVPGYSVPSFADWNNDKLKDLIVGQGGGTEDGKVRVYLNVGTESGPQFSDYFYVQSNDSDLTCSASGCMGCFPRVVYWDKDDLKDLLIGLTDGKIKIYLNIGTDEEPTFDCGTELKAGNDIIDVGSRATPTIVDWNNDGAIDMIVGAYDGKIHIFSNCGCDGIIPPDFSYSPAYGDFVREHRNNLVVPGRRSSPVIMDLDGDGKKDILTGNTDGELLLYSNVGSDAKPRFSNYTLVEADGVPINLPGTSRSRPFVCYWTGDGHFSLIDVYPDVLLGAGDGKVRLYRGVPIAEDFDGDGEVDFTDYAVMAEDLEEKDSEQEALADLNGDEKVDHRDLSRFNENWLKHSR
jgi:hypothetical protein